MQARLSVDGACVAGCWTDQPPSEAGVVADQGAGWSYFLLERHFGRSQCVGRKQVASVMCDALAVPLQASRRAVIFIELKTHGQFADAMPQLRAGIERLVSAGLPEQTAISAEIWYRREPKTRIDTSRIEQVAGRKVFIRHKKSA